MFIKSVVLEQFVMDDSCDRIIRVTKSCNVAGGVVEPDGSEYENHILGGVLSSKFIKMKSMSIISPVIKEAN